MQKIYKGQTALRLNFDLDADITGYTTTVINMQKPAGSTTTLTATVSDASTGAIYCNINTTTILDIKGKYLLQAKITYTDNTISYGETTYMVVYDYYE